MTPSLGLVLVVLDLSIKCPRSLSTKTPSHHLTSRNAPLLTPTFIYDLLPVPFNKQNSRGGAVVSTPDPLRSLNSLALPKVSL
jgi:hypothetical protein